MDDRKKNEDLDPEKIIEQMREEYWQGLSAPDEEVEEERVQLLVVEVAGERFGMEATLCRTITKAGKITRVPRMPAYLLGVINLRGEIVSVVDLAMLLGLADGEPGPKSRLAVVVSKGVKSAFQVERVIGIEFFEVSRIQEPDSMESPLRTDYLKGHVAPLEREGWITYLDMEKIVHGPEISMHR